MKHHREIQSYDNFLSLFMGLVEPNGTWKHHGGTLRFVDSSGSIIADQIDAQNYCEVIGEAVQKRRQPGRTALPSAHHSRTQTALVSV